MKKIIVMISLILLLSCSSAFSQDFEYTGFVKSVIFPGGYAVINENIYQPGEMIKDTSYKLIAIEYDYVVLENVKNKTQIKIGFKLGNKSIKS